MAKTDIKLSIDDKGILRSLATRGDKTAKAILDLADSRVAVGMMTKAPTTPSTQATGAGNTDWNVDIEKGIVVVGRDVKEFADQADFDVHSASQYTSLDSGDSAVATIVAKNVAGTITLHVVKGAAAVTGNQVAPTDDEIQVAVGADNQWIKIAELTINRTADTTVTQSQDNTKRNLGPVI